MIPKDKLILYFDRAMAFALCCLIFYLSFSIAGVEISAWVGIGFWTLKRVLGYRTKGLYGLIPETKLNKALIVFFLINVLSVVFSMYLATSLKGFFEKELKFLLIFFMLVEAISNEKRLRNMMYVIIFSAGLMVLDTIVQGIRGVDFLRNFPWVLARASFGTANDFAGWLIVIIPLLIGLLMSGSKKWLFSWIKIIVAVLIPLLSVCLLFAYSRGGWAGLLIGCLMGGFYIVWKMPVKTKIVILVLLIILSLVFIIFLPYIKAGINFIGTLEFRSKETIGNRVSVIGNSWHVRVQLWQEALRVIRDHPLLGAGFNTYSKVISSYKTFYFGGAYAHNSFLQMAAETGILGLLSFLWILLEYFKNSFRYLRQSGNYLVLGLMSGLLAYLAQSFVDTNLYDLQLAVLFWFILGLTFAVINVEQMK